MAKTAQAGIERKVTLARATLTWEALWAALCWPLILTAALAAIILSGLLSELPDVARYGVLAFSLGAIAWSLGAFRRVHWPSTYDAMRRIETKSSLANRPVSTLNDTLAGSDADEASRTLWEEHKRRQLAALTNLKIGPPQSTWRDLDPMSLRVPASLALIAGLFLSQGDGFSHFREAFNIGPVSAQTPMSLDAWLKPPAYTGKPPLLLTSPAYVERLKTDDEILVPENAGLVIRLNGASDPRLSFSGLADEGQTPIEIKDQPAKTRFESGVFEAETQLTRPALVQVFDGDTELASWRISLIPDLPPTIENVDQPKATKLGNLTLKWKAADDYGVASITSRIDLADEQADGVGFDGTGVFQFDPPKLNISLRKRAPKVEVGTTNADLGAHPWAGLMVDLTLDATDAAKQTATSKTISLKLPERYFTRPLARALVEQRKTLIMDPDASLEVEKLLSAILIYPEGLIDNSGTHIAIAAAISRIRNIVDHEDVEEAVNMLWQLAVHIEEGDLSDARAQVEAARKALERAIAEGASPEQLKELMSKLRDAMDKYLQSMKKEMERRLAEGQTNRQNPSPNSKNITEQDLQKMLDAIEKLAESGSKEAAQDLLAQLEELLKNMEPGFAQQGNQQGQQDGSEMLNELSEMMRKQQELMDQTQRGQGQELGEMGDDPGDNPGNRSGNSRQGDLADRQGDLERQLQEFMDKLGQQGLRTPPQLGEAGRQMNGAQESLEQRDRQQALGQQGEALDQMRQGAQDMARQMQQQAQGNQNNTGPDGRPGGVTDPLGRPKASNEEYEHPNENAVGLEQAARRAREILENLRSRSNIPDLPRIDRDYIERLLQGLY